MAGTKAWYAEMGEQMARSGRVDLKLYSESNQSWQAKAFREGWYKVKQK